MTKIIDLKPKKDVQMHIDKARKFIDAHLPSRYVSEVQKILPHMSSGMIRNTRSGIQNNLVIINALVAVAKASRKETESQVKKLKEINI